jgi:hypothetical protein
MKRKKMMSQQKTQGFTLVELTFAMFVLVIGVLGGMTMILMGMTRNSSNRVDTTATNAAQAVMEEIAGAPVNNNGRLRGADMAGFNRAWWRLGAWRSYRLRISYRYQLPDELRSLQQQQHNTDCVRRALEHYRSRTRRHGQACGCGGATAVHCNE